MSVVKEDTLAFERTDAFSLVERVRTTSAVGSPIIMGKYRHSCNFNGYYFGIGSGGGNLQLVLRHDDSPSNYLAVG